MLLVATRAQPLSMTHPPCAVPQMEDSFDPDQPGQQGTPDVELHSITKVWKWMCVRVYVWVCVCVCACVSGFLSCQAPLNQRT